MQCGLGGTIVESLGPCETSPFLMEVAVTQTENLVPYRWEKACEEYQSPLGKVLKLSFCLFKIRLPLTYII